MKRMYDDERRKTQTNERNLGQIANENKSLKNKVADLQR